MTLNSKHALLGFVAIKASKLCMHKDKTTLEVCKGVLFTSNEVNVLNSSSDYSIDGPDKGERGMEMDGYKKLS